MKLTLDVITVGKRHPLTISRGTSTGSDNLIVRLDYDDIEGMGEMAPTSGGAVAETALSAEAAFCRWIDVLEGLGPWDSQEIERRLNTADGRRTDLAARAALDMAMWDWKGKFAGVPVWKLLGLNRGSIPATSITVGINPPEVVRSRVQETLLRTGAKHLKVKLGSPDGPESDKVMFAAAQQAAVEIGEQLSSAPTWRVDANGGWSVETAVRMIEWLAERGVEYVEQPILRGREGDFAELHQHSALPIYADESVYLAEDIPPIAEYIDGVNLKLMKCGGITEAIRIIHTARAHNLRVMFGCMSETSLAITAAAQISPLADDLDLDSHLNLLPDPFSGAELLDGRIVPGDAPGLGVRARDGVTG
jgi:L-alanine-DL-glutamate epimerase-like enolase superfamily enzyme